MTAAWLLSLLAAQAALSVSVDRWPGPPWVEVGLAITTDPDPEALPGLTAATAALLEARARSVPAVADTVDVVARHGQIWLTVGLPSPQLSSVLPALWTKLSYPRVLEHEAEAALATAQARRRAQILDPVALARHSARADLFAGTGQSAPASGSLQGLAAMTRSDLATFLRRSMTRDRLSLRLVGAVPEPLQLDLTVGPTESTPERALPKKLAPPPTGRRLIIVDKPGAHRTLVAVGRWPAVATELCQSTIRTEDLGYGRVLWWRQGVSARVADIATQLLEVTQNPSPAPGCREDTAAAQRGDARRALRAWNTRQRADPSMTSSNDTAVVVVVVMALKAGLTESLSRQLGINQVSVVAYDQL